MRGGKPSTPPMFIPTSSPPPPDNVFSPLRSTLHSTLPPPLPLRAPPDDDPSSSLHAPLLPHPPPAPTTSPYGAAPHPPQSPLDRHAEPPAGQGGGDGAAEGSIKWPSAALILIGDMFGVGLLSLPGDFVRLGWLPCLAWLLVMAAGDCYSGRMYTRLLTSVPRTPLLDDIGAAAYGKRGRRAVRCTVYLVVGATPCLLHLTTVSCLQQIFPQWSSQRLALTLAVGAIMLPIAQIKGAAEVGAISALGAGGMLGVVLLLLLRLLAFPPSDVPGGSGGAAPPRTRLAGGSSPMSMVVGMMNIVFSFTGQEIWVRYGSSLRRRQRFMRAVTSAILFSTSMFLATGITTYAVLGDSIDPSAPITSSLPTPGDPWGVAMNCALLVHCLVHYQIILNVWVFLLLKFVTPEAAASLDTSDPAPPPPDYYSHHHTHPHTYWLAATVLGIAFSAAVAHLLPYFSELMGLIAAVGNLSAMFLLPAAFCLKLVKMGRVERGICRVLVPVSVGLSVLGVVGSVHQLVASVRGGKQ